MSRVGDARDDAEELADIAERLAPDLAHQPRIGARRDPASRPDGAAGCGPRRHHNCRRGSASEWISRRRRPRPAPRIRRARLPARPRAAPGICVPPWRCRVKPLPRPSVRSAQLMPRSTEATSSWVYSMLRIVQHPVGQPLLHHLAVPHHQHPVRQQPGGGDVMRHQQHGKAEIGHQRRGSGRAAAPAPRRRGRRSARP